MPALRQPLPGEDVSEIAAAMVAMNERKRALTDGASSTPAGEVIGLERLRLFCVGFGLDPEELDQQATNVAMQTIQSVAMRGPTGVPQCFAGTWVDGILTGLMIAERRQREGQQTRDYFYLCCNCGSIGEAVVFTPLQREIEEGPDEGRLRLCRPDESDPLVRCPFCGWLHTDDDGNPGLIDGAFESCAQERAALAADPVWAESWKDEAMS